MDYVKDIGILRCAQADSKNSEQHLIRGSLDGTAKQRWSNVMERFGLVLAVTLLCAPLVAGSQEPAPAGLQQNAGASETGAGQKTSAPTSNVAASQYAGPMDASRYVIGPEDSLQVTVWKEPTLSGTFPVRPDGMISLVLVGDLPAAGKTPTALSADITQRLKKYVQDPVVTVAVLGVNSQRVFMVGEVGKVGSVKLTPGMTVLQAIVTAGGLNQFANSKHIYILRSVSGKEQKIPFNYKQALKGIDEGAALLPGDTIVVP